MINEDDKKELCDAFEAAYAEDQSLREEAINALDLTWSEGAWDE